MAEEAAGRGGEREDAMECSNVDGIREPDLSRWPIRMRIARCSSSEIQDRVSRQTDSNDGTGDLTVVKRFFITRHQSHHIQITPAKLVYTSQLVKFLRLLGGKKRRKKTLI